MHITKFNSNQIGQVISHIERPEGRNYSNKNIDKSRSKDNYTLVDRGGTDYINKRIEQVKHLKRADVVKLVGVSVTLPQDYKGNEKDFFKAVTLAFAERYGKENIAYATVHKDETSPHIHIGVIPITRDKNGQEKLCAKEVFNKQELQRLHPEIEKAVSDRLRKPVHLLNGKTEKDPETGRAYKDVKELKRKREKEEKELPKNFFNNIDYKKAYEQERKKNISKQEENGKLKEEIRDLKEEVYRQASRASRAEKSLKAETEERYHLQQCMNNPEILKERYIELKEIEKKKIERNKHNEKDRDER